MIYSHQRQFIFRLWLSLPYSDSSTWEQFYKNKKKEFESAKLNKINNLS